MRNGFLHLAIKNQLSELEPLAMRVEEFVEDHGLPPKTAQEINLCLDEVVTNIVSYGYDDKNEHVIDVRIALDQGQLKIEIEDDARAFDPLQAADPDVTKPIEERSIGGLGVFFVRKLMTHTAYEREGGKNKLVLGKRVG